MADYLSLWATFGVWFYGILPNSPFAQFNGWMVDVIQPYIKYLNWFIPVDWCLTALGVWVSAISVFYLAQSVGRWLKALGGG